VLTFSLKKYQKGIFSIENASSFFVIT